MLRSQGNDTIFDVYNLNPRTPFGDNYFPSLSLSLSLSRSRVDKSERPA